LFPHYINFHCTIPSSTVLGGNPPIDTVQ